jgi:hypothetical protein
VKATNWTGTHYQNLITWSNANKFLRIQYTGKRFDYRCFLVGDAVRNLVKAIDSDYLIGNDHEFGKSARELVSHGKLIGADCHLAFKTSPALSTWNSRDYLNTVTDFYAGYFATNFNNLAGNFVTDDLWWL